MTTITIIYKNGQKVRLKVKSFSVKRNTAGAMSLEWDTAKLPKKPLLIGVDDIAAIYEGRV